MQLKSKGDKMKNPVKNLILASCCLALISPLQVLAKNERAAKKQPKEKVAHSHSQCHSHSHSHHDVPRSLAAPMMRGDTLSTNQGWKTLALVTTGEKGVNNFTFNQNNFNYNPLGIFDGIGPIVVNDCILKSFINHEVPAGFGLPYTLANATQLTGARIDAWDITRKGLKVKKGALAYNTIIDREGVVVTNAQQLNKGREESALLAGQIGQGFLYDGGFTLLCSGGVLGPNKGGFPNELYFAGEELFQGQGTVTDPCTKTNYVVPMLGQIAFENAVPLANFNSNKVALLIGQDDGNPAPLWLYVGELGATPPATAAYSPPELLVKNGLGFGRLYVWVADDPNLFFEGDFVGTGNSASGKFVFVQQYDPSQEGQPGYDNLGFLKGTSLPDAFNQQFGPLQSVAIFEKNAFVFMRPEDLSPNPLNRTQAVFSTTGILFQAPDCTPPNPNPIGRLYILDLATSVADVFQQPIECIDEFDASLRILYDSCDAGGGQFATPLDGIRSPDNVEWATDGFIYVQEDMNSGSFCPTGIQNSMWQVNPYTSGAVRILEIDRSAVPQGQIDVSPNTCNAWESSGVVDVSDLIDNPENRTLLLFDVQAHSIIQSNPPGLFDLNNLVEGAQWLLAIGPKRNDADTLCKFCKQANAPFAKREVGQCQQTPPDTAKSLQRPGPLSAEEAVRFTLAKSHIKPSEFDMTVENALKQFKLLKNAKN